VVELAPILLAVRDHRPGTIVKNGGVANLISAENVADVAGNAETQALRQSVKRPDIRIIMTVVEGDYRIVARRSAGIASLADLKGKKIATMKATSAEYFLDKMLRHAGLKSADVTVLNTPVGDMVSAIEKHEIDAAAIWEPWSENALLALGKDSVEFSGKGIYFEHYNLNTTAGALADPAKRREIVALVRQIIAATEAIKKNPAEAQALVAKSGGYTVEEVARSWKHHTWTAGFAEDMRDVLTEEEVWLAAQENRPPRSRAELAPLIDRSVYEEAKRK
jgi:NitT/TauT family transport system substrate-binding protein